MGYQRTRGKDRVSGDQDQSIQTEAERENDTEEGQEGMERSVQRSRQTVYDRNSDGISENEAGATSKQMLGEDRRGEIKGRGEILSGPQSHVHLPLHDEEGPDHR